MSAVEYAAHTAYLDPMTGVGLLVCPIPANDVMMTGESTLSLAEADWNAAMADLAARGWEPAESESGGLDVVGYTSCGRQAIALYGLDPITSSPTVSELASALDAQMRCASVLLTR